MEIKINIKNCSECPFVKIEKVYTADSWEDVSKWSCTKKKNKTIHEYVEWNDKITKIPDWCPVKVK